MTSIKLLEYAVEACAMAVTWYASGVIGRWLWQRKERQ